LLSFDLFFFLIPLPPRQWCPHQVNFFLVLSLSILSPLFPCGVCSACGRRRCFGKFLGKRSLILPALLARGGRWIVVLPGKTVRPFGNLPPLKRTFRLAMCTFFFPSTRGGQSFLERPHVLCPIRPCAPWFGLAPRSGSTGYRLHHFPDPLFLTNPFHRKGRRGRFLNARKSTWLLYSFTLFSGRA